MTNYEFLTPDNIAAYILAHDQLSSRIDADRLASVEEIGDGNLNLVFVMKDENGRGLCLKQALPYVRMTGEGWPMTPERARFEAQSLQLHERLRPGSVVSVIDFNPERYVIAMEDLSDHTVWRTALNNSEVHHGVSEEIGKYVASVAFGSSALGMERIALADQQKISVNPELCVITEDLVFTEPSVDAGRNETIPENEADAQALAADVDFTEAMGLAKWKFMTQAEALIHGDLHTGSIMVRKSDAGDVDSVKVFDSEFAFYGPIGFDLGLLWANFLFAAARATALGEDERAQWAADQIEQSWIGFETEFRALWPKREDPRVWRDYQRDSLLKSWKSDAWLFAAAELSRRVVGAAKNSDIETLNTNLREGAARGLLQLARKLAVEYDSNNINTSELLDVLTQTATR
ncbi:MAG: S-methyl-5-thioribose kinase [Canibacter sp.]